MPRCTPIFALESSQETESSRLAEAIRSLVLVLNDPAQTGVENCTVGSTERVLVDTEVDGVRYLFVRMARPSSRVQLSPREQEIVRMVAQGHPNKVIADVLNISAWTVCTHLRRIFAKLGVGSRAAMVAQLLDLGVIRKERHPLEHPR